MAKMKEIGLREIKSFAFFDTESTGLSKFNYGKSKFVELAINACSVEDFLLLSKSASDKSDPRVENKLTICINPHMLIQPASTKNYSGIDNYMLEEEKFFTENTIELLNSFLNHLQQPVCLISHYGNGTEFPMLKTALNKLNKTLSDSILCLDSLEAFRHIDDIVHRFNMPDINLVEDDKCVIIDNSENTGLEFSKDINRNIQNLNEQSPISGTNNQRPICNTVTDAASPHNNKKNLSNQKDLSTVKRQLFSPGKPPPKWTKPYSLPNFYQRVFNTKMKNAHQAEVDAICLREIAIRYGEHFVKYAKCNAVPFSTIHPM